MQTRRRNRHKIEIISEEAIVDGSKTMELGHHCSVFDPSALLSQRKRHRKESQLPKLFLLVGADSAGSPPPHLSLTLIGQAPILHKIRIKIEVEVNEE